MDELSEQTKFHFYVCNTELLYQKRQFEEAQKSLDVAYQIAKACQFEEQTLWEELPGSNCCRPKVNSGTSTFTPKETPRFVYSFKLSIAQ